MARRKRAEELRVEFEKGVREADEALVRVKIERMMRIGAVLNE